MLIGICGKKQHGKDTIARILEARYGFRVRHFADPLKTICAAVFGLNNEQLHGRNKEVRDNFWGTTPRAIMQVVGTDLFRNELARHMPEVGHNIWIRSFAKTYESDVNTVIADVRFTNEYEWIKRVGGIVIRVNRPGLVNTDGSSVIHNYHDRHESENSLDEFESDYVIENSHCFAHLETEIEKIISKHRTALY